jgi:2-keto-4-pentenoate hydratase/2-oxohepta-3-ene-1,7-dioic acid hydratase in catechol pathway
MRGDDVKIARFDGGRTGLVVDRRTGPGLLDVGASLAAFARSDLAGANRLRAALGEDGTGTWFRLIDRWEELRGHLQSMADSATAQGSGMVVHDLSDVKLSAPLPSRHARTFALGGNFSAHLSNATRAVYHDNTDPPELLRRRRQQGPWGFHVLPETIVGPDDVIVPPPGFTKIDYEGEVAVILRNGGRGMRAEDVQVWGFTAWNDFSLRDGAFDLGPVHDKGTLNWALEKNFDTGTSCGPWLVVDEPYDVRDLHITLRVNGETRTDGSTSDMIFGFAETVEHLSLFITMRPGDVVASGTPGGVAVESGIDGPYLEDGDVTELEVEGVGLLRNEVAMVAAVREPSHRR